MATLTIEYNPRSNVAVSVINLIKQLSGIKVVESPYDPKFVAKIKRSAASPKRLVDPNTLFKK